MSFYLPNGTGESLGDVWATAAPIQGSGNAWYVQSTNGVDAATPAGKDKEKPLATLAQAQTNAAAGDVIFMLPAHTETMTARLDITKRVALVGCGTSGGKPAVQIKGNSAGVSVLGLTVAGIELRNVYFPEHIQSNTSITAKCHVTNSLTGIKVIGCYFEQGANDQELAALSMAAGTAMLVENCTFISTATVVATRPPRGLYTPDALTNCLVRGCIFSDGTVGFSTAACDLPGTHVGLTMESISMLLGADIKLTGTTPDYKLNVQTATGGGRVEL